MLDKKTLALLNVLNELGTEDSYKVVTTGELISRLPVSLKFDEENIKVCIEFLEEYEYISLKFEEDQTYCYTLLPKSKSIAQQTVKGVKIIKESNTKDDCPLKLGLICFLASATATFLACLLFYFTFLR